jgi:hypothetical protein
MIPRLRARAPGTRATRMDPRERRLESLAGEFALLAQRRTRTLHQLELLDQQRGAAAGALLKMQGRLAWLLRQMDALDPGLRDPYAYAPEPEPPPPPPPPPPLQQPSFRAFRPSGNPAKASPKSSNRPGARPRATGGK